MRLNFLVACVSSLLLAKLALRVIVSESISSALPVQAFPAQVLAQKTSSSQLSSEQLHRLAKAITVRVFSEKRRGSGILVQRQGETYTVLTNEHVVNSSSQYHIQTADGKIYPAAVNWSVKFGDNDLGVLQFRSPNHYAVASLGTTSSLTVGDEVFAAGFPIETETSRSKGFVVTTGKISLLMEQAFVGGYQSGYTNQIEWGMSGGPLLNRRGEVIGINGMTKYPLWGNPYVFKDGSSPSEAMRQQMIHYSWAIPIETFLRL